MFHRVLSMIRRTNGDSGFEAYLARLQRHNASGAPTRNEARRDYRELIGGHR